MFAWKTRYLVTPEQLRLLEENPNVASEQPPQNVKKTKSDTNSSQSNTQIHDDSNPLKLELDDEAEHPLKLNMNDSDKLTEELDNEIKLEKLKFPTIYTITKNKSTGDKPLVVWGIKNSKQFTEL